MKICQIPPLSLLSFDAHAAAENNSVRRTSTLARNFQFRGIYGTLVTKLRSNRLNEGGYRRCSRQQRVSKYFEYHLLSQTREIDRSSPDLSSFSGFSSRRRNHENGKNHAGLFETNQNPFRRALRGLILIGKEIPKRRTSWKRFHVTLVLSSLSKLSFRKRGTKEKEKEKERERSARPIEIHGDTVEFGHRTFDSSNHVGSRWQRWIPPEWRTGFLENLRTYSATNDDRNHEGRSAESGRINGSQGFAETFSRFKSEDIYIYIYICNFVRWCYGRVRPRAADARCPCRRSAQQVAPCRRPPSNGWLRGRKGPLASRASPSSS